MKAEISQLDSQISGAEEHLETQGLSTKFCSSSHVPVSLTKSNKYVTSAFTFCYRAVNQLHLGSGGGQSSQRATPAGLQAAVRDGP